MNKSQIKACRDRQVQILAARKDGDEFAARKLYDRCVRYCLRYFRWGETQANGPSHYNRWQQEHNEHEGELLASLRKRLSNELKEYGLEWEHSGLYPILIDASGNHVIELFWY